MPTSSSAPTAFAPRCGNFCSAPKPPRFFGAAAYRAIFPAERLRGLQIPDCTKWWGSDRHCLPYYLTGKRDEVYAIGVVPVSHWDGDEASVPTSREEHTWPRLRISTPICSACLRRRQTSACGRSTIANATIAGAAAATVVSARRRLSSDAAVHGGRRRHGGRGRRDPEPLPGDMRRAARQPSACYVATRIPRVGDVQRISIENSWMRGPTDTDWFYCYDPCTAPLVAAML